MNYLHLSITQIHQALLNNEVTPLDLVKEAINKAKNDTNNAFEYIYDKEAFIYLKDLENKDKNNLLWGIPFTIKDNYSTKGIPTNGSSNSLKGYIPLFDSEVYQRLINVGAIPIGKTTLDELGMGGSGTQGHLGTTFNPHDSSHRHIIGGSSCGSAASVSAGIVPFSIGSDTGDSVRKPASYAGLVGLKPTWGRISRYGLFSFASSLDHVGFFTRNVIDSAIILSNLAGFDEKDLTSSRKEVPDYLQAINKNNRYRIAVIKQIYDSIDDGFVKERFEKSLNYLSLNGHQIEFVDMDYNLCKAIYPTYIILSSCEATSNYARIDGVKYGLREKGDSVDEMMRNTRSTGFSSPIKLRFIVGSYSLTKQHRFATFERAMKCRKLIVDSINDILKKYDFIYLPASPSTAPLIGENSHSTLHPDSVISDNYLAIGNFAGLPSLTFPLGIKDGLPFGGNFTGNLFKEEDLFSIVSFIEDFTGLKGLVK